MLETSLPAGLEHRREDYKLITGTSHYVDDLRPPQRRPAALHMAVVRSPYAHAEIKGIQLDAARTLPGIAAFAGAELVSSVRTIDTIPAPGLKKPERRSLALGRVRYVGDPVAVVLAENLYAAIDARDLVEEQPNLIEREAPNPANGVPIEGLAAWRDFIPSSATFSSGAHLAVVEVDTGTGEVYILTYVAVDDCGRVLNHYLAEAQVHGALAQGIGQALYEEVMYDQDGQLLTGSLMDYTMPNAEQVPNFVTGLVETPSPINPLGAKGVGEAGCIGAPPAIVNAVLDALAPLGIKTIDMPLKPEKVWALVQAARHGTLEQSDPTPPPVFSADEKEQGGEVPDFA